MKLGVAVVMVLLAAGCTDAAPSTADAMRPGAPGPGFSDGRGAIEGVVVDDTFVPVAGAEVSIAERSLTTQTDEAGAFQFADLEVGGVTVLAQAGAFASATAAVDVVAETVTPVTLVLQRGPSTGSFYATVQEDGEVMCNAHFRVQDGEYRPGLCSIPTVFGIDVGDRSVLVVPGTEPGWRVVKGGVLETDWQSSQALGNALLVEWVILEGSSVFDSKGGFVAGKASGTSPLRQVLDEATVQTLREGDPSLDAFCPEVGSCNWMLGVQPWSSAFGDAYPVDTGVAMSQRFTHYLTTFYGAPPPEGFSALPDA